MRPKIGIDRPPPPSCSLSGVEVMPCCQVLMPPGEMIHIHATRCAGNPRVHGSDSTVIAPDPHPHPHPHPHPTRGVVTWSMEPYQLALPRHMPSERGRANPSTVVTTVTCEDKYTNSFIQLNLYSGQFFFQCGGHSFHSADIIFFLRRPTCTGSACPLI